MASPNSVRERPKEVHDAALEGLTQRLSSRSLQAGLAAMRMGPLLMLVVLVIAMALLSPYFFTERNLQNVLVQSSIVAALALGQLFVILTGGIDISVGSLIALSAVIGGLIAVDSSVDVGFVVLLGILATGAVAGLVNGVVFVKGRLPHPFINTLAMLSIASGLALTLSDAQPLAGMPPLLRTLGSDFIGPVPVPALLVGVLAFVAWLVTRRMQWGRWIYAIGGNAEGARRAGIPVDRVLISVYVISGLAAGFAAVITVGRTDVGSPTAGRLAELDAIAAVIIGGASFLGGRGGVMNAIVGALVIGVIRNGLNLLGVDPAVQLVFIGIIVVVAVELDVIRGRIEQRFRALRGAVP